MLIPFQQLNFRLPSNIITTTSTTPAHPQTNFLPPQFVILVIDSTDRERLSITREELYKMLAHEELSRAAVLIYANKQDVKGSMSAAEISRLLNLTSIKKHRWQIQGCCALTGEGWESVCVFVGGRDSFSVAVFMISAYQHHQSVYLSYMWLLFPLKETHFNTLISTLTCCPLLWGI